MCRDLCTPAPSMSNETWFSAGIFPRLESTECRDFRHKCAHTSWLPRRRSWPAGDLQKWEISGKIREESWRPLGKVACLVNFYCKAVGGRTKIPQNAQEQRKKPQVQCTTSLIYLCREVWRSFVLFGGNFRTALSHKRNWPWSTSVTNMKAYTKGGLLVVTPRRTEHFPKNFRKTDGRK